jgi:hypothetical protein
MARRGLIVAVWAALGLLPLACTGDDEEVRRADADAAPSVATTIGPTSTGALEESPTATAEAAPSETADPAVIANAAGATAGAGSARVATSVTVIGPGDLKQSFGGDGEFDFDRRIGRLTLDLGDGTQGVSVTSSTVVFVDSVVYYELPAGLIPGGKRWLQIDLQSVANASSLDFGPLLQGSQADASQYLLWLTAVSPAVTKLGEGEVRGVPTTRYRALVDLVRLEEQAPPGREDEWRAYVETLQGRLAVEAVPVEIWVDGDGLIRRLHLEYAFTSEGSSTTVTTELYDFGVQVDATAPPPGQVAVIDDFIRP